MSTSAWKRISSAFFALTLVLAAGCGSDSTAGTNTGGPTSVPGTTYSGVLDDGSTVSLTFSTAASALVADRAATVSTVNVSGTLITATGTSYPITGTYDPSTGKFDVTAGPTGGSPVYTLSGTYANGAFTGTYTGPSGSGALAAGNAASVKYCGTYSGSGEYGAFMVVVTGQKAFLVVNGVAAEGSVSGSTVTFSVAATSSNPKIDVTGQISGSAVSGTWTATDGSGTGTGTWSGSSTSCGGSSSGTTNTQCNAINGTWSVGATTNQTASNATCGAILTAVGGQIGRAATVTVTTSGNSVTVVANGDPLTGTLDPTTCKVSLSTPISGSVTVNNASVAITGTQKNDITFNSNSSLTNDWTLTINTATGQSGLPCTVTATQSGTK